jgi:hypothetical protein
MHRLPRKVQEEFQWTKSQRKERSGTGVEKRNTGQNKYRSQQTAHMGNETQTKGNRRKETSYDLCTNKAGPKKTHQN